MFKKNIMTHFQILTKLFAIILRKVDLNHKNFHIRSNLYFLLKSKAEITIFNGWSLDKERWTDK